MLLQSITGIFQRKTTLVKTLLCPLFPRALITRSGQETPQHVNFCSTFHKHWNFQTLCSVRYWCEDSTFLKKFIDISYTVRALNACIVTTQNRAKPSRAEDLCCRFFVFDFEKLLPTEESIVQFATSVLRDGMALVEMAGSSVSILALDQLVLE
jgi:hypothetical protein